MLKKFHKLMERSIPLWFVGQIMLLGFLATVVIAWAAQDAANGKRQSGIIGATANKLAVVPTVIAAWWADDAGQVIVKAPTTQPAGWSRILSANDQDAGYLLLSRFDWQTQRYVAELVDVSNGVVVRRYQPLRTVGESNEPLRRWLVSLDPAEGRMASRMFHPYLTADGGLVYQNASPLTAIDVCGRTKWTIPGHFHHSIEADADGNYWVPATLAKAKQPGVSASFEENAIAHISADGKILSRTSFYDILKAAGLLFLLDRRPYSDDPYHLNDIQPALVDGRYWLKGDIFISARHLSLVMLYRPSTGKVLWWREGPWQKQHDVNILDDHRISIFDNHTKSASPRDIVDGTNQILIYNFENDAVTPWSSKAFQRQRIATPFQGRGLIVDNGDAVVEETNLGRVMRLAVDGTIKWQYISATPNGDRLMLAWSRYISGDIHASAITAAKEAKCI
jgi:hypothetical protein